MNWKPPPNTCTWSDTQHRRLRELGGNTNILRLIFLSHPERDKSFQQVERKLTQLQNAKLQEMISSGGKPELERLADKISNALISSKFLKVTTQTILSKLALEKMTIDEDHPLFKQVYWISKKQCLRPMLAPNLYSLMQDFSRQTIRPIRFFEIGSCFRKETDGANHASEFTMLNLVEMGVPLENRESRLRELGALIMSTVGIQNYEFEKETSEVYGTTMDIVEKTRKIEMASGAFGPHPLDEAWGVHESWVGLGVGLERLLMLANNDSSISRYTKGTSYINGVPMRI